MQKLLFFVEQPYSFPILRPLEAAAKARGIEVRWFLYDLPASYLTPEEHRLPDTAAVNDYNPDAVICPGNWVPYFWPGHKIQVFHGFGIDKKGHFNIRGFFDLYCTHGPLTTSRFKAAEPKYGYFRSVETGWPKMDPYAAAVDTRTAITAPPRVLYAPTFSPSLTSTYALLEPLRELTKAGNADITVKFHPMMAEEQVTTYKAAQNDHFRVVENTDLLPALQQADIVLSDTSSVVAESLCIGKPVITLNTLHPGPYVLNITEPGELANAIHTCTEHYSERKDAGKAYADQMHPYQDGKSSDRVLDAIDNHLKEGHKGLKKLPFNWLRKRKVAKKMRKYEGT
ncbi:CDP-glycerol glycerophosphotransferase family protein [Saccharospirillum alexandrii]|uniref:CDP-glycerol glycerophosphotransferase family protein n=1 Tax=Saccharospirillum alexandrii TaxID=2448477 RepID=UPI00373561A6